jgi:putative salt-induced outer membrane protein
LKKIVLSAVLASTLIVAAHAEDMKVTPLVTHTEFGYIETNGNTKTKTFNLDTNAKKAWDKHEGKVEFDGQYAQDSGNETKNKYIVELNYDYAFTDRFAFDYLVGYKVDKFSSFDYQFYTGPGARYKAIVSEVDKLTVEGNILYAQDKYSDINYDATGVAIEYPNPDNIAIASTVYGTTKNYASYRFKGVYNHKFSKTVKFNQELSLRGALDNTKNYFAYSKSSLNSKISDIFSAGVSYKVDYVNQPSTGKKNTDTTLTLNLIMDY